MLQDQKAKLERLDLTPDSIKRLKTQPSQLDCYSIKDTANKVVEQTSKAREELLKLRSDIRVNDEFHEFEMMSKSSTKEIEIMKMIKELQSEVQDLNGMINTANEKIKDKENENRLLKENITQIRQFYEKEKNAGCKCQLF